GAEDRRADRDRGLDSLLADLPPLALLRLLGAAQALLERGALGRVLLAQGLHALVPVGPGCLADPHPEVPLALARPRDGARLGIAEKLQPSLAVEPRDEVPVPGLVALGLRGGGR